MDTTKIPVSFHSWASIQRRFILWLTLCVVCSIPSYLLASSNSYLPLALSLAIISFAVLMTCITSLPRFYELSRIPYMRKSMYVGYGIRIALSIIFPVGFFIDALTGILTMHMIDTLSAIATKRGFVSAFIGTLIQGTLMNVVVSICIVTIWFVPWWNSKFKEDAKNTMCDECLFDLKRIPKGAPCPECGTLKPEKEPTNTSCFNCGYNLKATTDGSACPECGSKEGAGDPFDATPLSRIPSWTFQLWSASILLFTISILAMNTLSLIYQ